MSDRYKNLEKKMSEFQKEDNINNLTKQTLFDHLNNVDMSSNKNTQSARVNAGCNTSFDSVCILLEGLWKVLKTRVLRVPRAGCLT